MVADPGQSVIPYRRSRFRAQLPTDRLYSAAHYWLHEEAPGVWRIGFTKFATRMLGDLVEYDFPLPAGTNIAVGEEIGTVEGFKAVTALYSVMEGEFLGSNEALAQDITLVEHDPFRRGWLYRVQGRPDPECMDVHAYIALLDTTIDQLMESRYAGAGSESDED